MKGESMAHSSISERVQERVQRLLILFPSVSRIAHKVADAGGQLLLVGGAVRNCILGLPVHDVDVEVHGLSFDTLESLLSTEGSVDFVGKSFGVLRVAGMPIDWSLPRIDSAGRKPSVQLYQTLPLEQALRRRDLTINAMALDPLISTLYDPFGGMRDLVDGRLRAPDVTLFIEDPLRLYRVMQFIGRLNMYPDDALNELCTSMDIQGVSRERIIVEFHKLLMLSYAPSKGIRWLAQIGRLQEIMPELGCTQGVLQEYTWHPEGDVFEHTMQALDAAAQQSYPSYIMRRTVIYAVLCHDLGKSATTRIEHGMIRSIGHEQAGIIPAQQLLKRIVHEKKLQHAVVLAVRHHMAPGQFVSNNAGAAAYKRLAAAIAPYLDLEALAYLARADQRGRNPQRGKPLSVQFSTIDLFTARARELGVLRQAEPALVTGADVMGIINSGPDVGRILQHAYELQIAEGIQDKAELLRRVL